MLNDPESILSLGFSPHMARVRARDATGFIAQCLRCETCAQVCFHPLCLTLDMLSFIPFRCTERLSRALCVCSSWSALAFSNTFIRNWCRLHTVSYVFRAGQNIWFIELDLCIKFIKAAAVYDIISNNQMAIMRRKTEKPIILSVNFRIHKKQLLNN